MKTRAAVSTGPAATFVIREVDLADPQPDELLVRIEAVGICHTDLATKAMFPAGVSAVFGHEGAGVVEQVGSAVTDVRPGDHVIFSFASCGACDRCAARLPGYCVRFLQASISGVRLDGTPTLSSPDGPVSGNFFGQSSFARYALTRRARPSSSALASTSPWSPHSAAACRLAPGRSPTSSTRAPAAAWPSSASEASAWPPSWPAPPSVSSKSSAST